MEAAERLSMAEKLVGLSRVDWNYTDLYLERAEIAFAGLCSRERFRVLRAQRSRIGSLASDLGRARWSIPSDGSSPQTNSSLYS